LFVSLFTCLYVVLLLLKEGKLGVYLTSLYQWMLGLMCTSSVPSSPDLGAVLRGSGGPYTAENLSGKGISALKISSKWYFQYLL